MAAIIDTLSATRCRAVCRPPRLHCRCSKTVIYSALANLTSRSTLLKIVSDLFRFDGESCLFFASWLPKSSVWNKMFKGQKKNDSRSTIFFQNIGFLNEIFEMPKPRYSILLVALVRIYQIKYQNKK